MNSVTTNNRREKRKASGKGASLLSDLEDDFLDIEKNFKLEVVSAQSPINNHELKSFELPHYDINENNFERSKIPTSPEKSSNKEVTNWEQSDIKVVTNKPENWYQSGNKPVTEIGPNLETGNKVVSKPVTELVTNWEQTSNKLVTKSSFSQLTGLQRNLIVFFYNSCRIERSKSTQALTLEHLTDTFKTSSGTLKTTIRRLERKNCVKRISFKNGRGGWSKYEITETLFNEMLQLETGNKLVTNWNQTGNKLVAKPVTEPVTSFSSSSSNIYNTTTNYQADASKDSDIILPELLLNSGFNQGHVTQLLRDSSLVPEEIQKSLEAFAFDLSHEDVKKKVRSPIGLIMKLLKNGQPYISEKGYESEEDRLYRELIERAEKSRNEKKNLSLRMIDVKFDEWIESIPDEEKKNLVEPIGEFMGLLHLQDLKEYFKREVLNVNS